MVVMWCLLSNRKISKTLCTYSSVGCVKVIKPQDLTTAESVTGSIYGFTTNYTHNIRDEWSSLYLP